MVDQNHQGSAGDELRSIGVEGFVVVLLAGEGCDGARLKEQIGEANPLLFISFGYITKIQQDFLVAVLIHRLEAAGNFIYPFLVQDHRLQIEDAAALVLGLTEGRRWKNGAGEGNLVWFRLAGTNQGEGD